MIWYILIDKTSSYISSTNHYLVLKIGSNRAGLYRKSIAKSSRYQLIIDRLQWWELFRIKAIYSPSIKKVISIPLTQSTFWRKFKSFIRARRFAYFGITAAFTWGKKPRGILNAKEILKQLKIWYKPDLNGIEELWANMKKSFRK